MPRADTDTLCFGEDDTSVAGLDDSESTWDKDSIEITAHASESHPPVQSPSPPSTPKKQPHERSRPNPVEYSDGKPKNLFKQFKPQAQPPLEEENGEVGSHEGMLLPRS